MQKEQPEINMAVFEQAATEAIKITQRTRTITVSETETESDAITERDMTKMPSVIVETWEDLKHAMDNEHAKKFNQILKNLPDREFIRVYLKAMEFFKPKVIREASGRGKKDDTTINIQVNYGSTKQE